MKKVLIFFLIGFIFSSCSFDDSNLENSVDYSDYVTENGIETDINFMPAEKYIDLDSQQPPSLQLRLATTEIYPCVNYGLVTSKFIIGNEMIIRFDEVTEPEICLTAMGPAISYIELPENISKLTFINANIIDKYALEINEEKVSVSLLENNFTISLHDKTFRIPENSFAYVCGTNTNNTYIYEDFLTILEENPSFTEFTFEGEGRIPYPESTQGHWVDHPSRFFLYSDESEFENLENVLSDYSIQNIEENSGVSIAIYGWNNTKYYSWLND